METGGGNTEEGGYSDETFDFLCSVCKHRDNKNSEAEKYCWDCCDYFCTTCVKFHDHVTVLSSHNIVDKGQNSLGMCLMFPVVPTEKCGRHGQQPLDMYCQDDDFIGCPTCIATDHKICQGIAYITDYVQRNPQAINSNDTEIKLESLIKNLNEIEITFVQEKRHLLNIKQRETKKIQELREDSIKRLDILEENTLDTLESRCQAIQVKTENAIKIIQDLTARVKSAEDDVRSAGANMSQLFVSLKKARKVASLAKQVMNSTYIEFYTEGLSFAPHQKLLTLLNDIQELGQYSLKKLNKETGTNTEPELKPKKLETGTNTEPSLKPKEKETGTNNEPEMKPKKMETGTNIEPVLRPKKIETGTNMESEVKPKKTFMGTGINNEPVLKPKKMETGTNNKRIQMSDSYKILADEEKSSEKEKPHKRYLPVVSTYKDKTLSANTGITQMPVLSLDYEIQKNRKRNPGVADKTMTDGSAQISVRVSSNRCSIFDACKLDDGTIILMDAQFNELKFLHKYTQFIMQKSYQLPKDWNYGEVHVCAISNEEVAVGHSTSIWLVSIWRSSTVTRKITTNSKVEALTYNNGTLYYSNGKSIKMINLFGKSAEESLTIQSGSRKPFPLFKTHLFSDIRSMAFSLNGSRMFIADVAEGLIILNMNGCVTGQCHFKGASCLCLYKNNILVAGPGSSQPYRVVEFSPEGKMIRTVIELNDMCNAICCNQDNTKLIICYKERDEIEVIDLNSQTRL